MGNQKSTSIIVTILKEQKHALKKIASQRNIKNPDYNETISSLCREVITEFLARDNNPGLDIKVRNVFI
ncbi:MAG: hypothetical protein WCQ99_13530 [Pseudomonadota bacterium]